MTKSISVGTLATIRSAVSMGFFPRVLAMERLGYSKAGIVNKLTMVDWDRPVVPILQQAILRKPIEPMMHTCSEMVEDYFYNDGPSPSECCEACKACKGYRSVPVVGNLHLESCGCEACRNEVVCWAPKNEKFVDAVYDMVEMEVEKDMKVWRSMGQDAYQAMIEAKEDEQKASAKKAEAELEQLKAKVLNHVVATVELPDNMRAYIRSVDGRAGKVKENEFNGWLAIPKNRRPIYLEGGRVAPGVAKADIGSVVIKSCPATVLLSDIRLVLAKFGGVRDVYRPKDRATGAPKPFVFVEMLKNAEAWTAVDYFAKNPFTLDEHTFLVEGAGERKTSTEMATIQPTVEVVKQVATKVEKKAIKPTGAFSALMDSDSDSE